MKLKAAADLLKINLQALAIFDANNTVLTVSECADWLGCHSRTVVNKIDSGKIMATESSDGKYEIPKIQFLNKIVEGWVIDVKSSKRG